MLICQVARVVKQTDTKLTSHTSILVRHFCLGIDDSPVKRQKRTLREWRKMPEREPTFLGLFDRSAIEPKAKKDISFGNPERGETVEFNFANLKRRFFETTLEFKKVNQKFEPERLKILGADLAAAHFLIFRGGKVKFFGKTEWMMSDEGYANLPKSFDARYILDGIDCSGMELYYEGFLNLENLTRVKWASFKNNPVFDEWCLDRIVGHMPRLEYLNVSDCPKLDERGLECLYKLFNLKTLIVTNHHKSAAFELTCLMLEDCNPNLKCEILEPGQESNLPDIEAISKTESDTKIKCESETEVK